MKKDPRAKSRQEMKDAASDWLDAQAQAQELQRQANKLRSEAAADFEAAMNSASTGPDGEAWYFTWPEFIATEYKGHTYILRLDVDGNGHPIETIKAEV